MGKGTGKKPVESLLIRGVTNPSTNIPHSGFTNDLDSRERMGKVGNFMKVVKL